MAFWESAEHAKLVGAAERLKKTHLKVLLESQERNDKLFVNGPEGLVGDFSRENVDAKVLEDLFDLAKKQNVAGKIKQMFNGECINETERRSVLHVALRAPATAVINDPHGKNVVTDVHSILNKIECFTRRLRSGELVGFTGKKLNDIICIGIGGSYLGVEFVVEALKTDSEAREECKGRRIHFLANVDPIDVLRATEDFDQETTLVIVISKTFTTAETMLNARTIREWLLSKLQDEKAIAKHVLAVSTNYVETSKFGIDPENVFGFWDWVGGRFSVCSAVGALPLACFFGFPIVKKFLEGCHCMDQHFLKNCDSPQNNLPLMMALMSVWNSTYMGHSCVAVLPYCQALHRFAAHVQQLVMESNGKGVTLTGAKLPVEAGEIYFGEPGTNGQHSFYQLVHQGRVIPAEFIGFRKSQNPVHLAGEAVSNHDELMSNFFAQPDALAIGKSEDQLKNERVHADLIPHKTFSGNRPSAVIMGNQCDPFNVGMLLALYEHRTAAQGFIWGINSFDQWGVELGKVLAKNIRQCLQTGRDGTGHAVEFDSLPSSTKKLLELYLQKN